MRFLEANKAAQPPLDVWVTLIPPSETQPAVPPTPPNFTDCAKCPSSHPHPYGGGGTGGGFCCPRPSHDHEHCPGSAECCLSPLPGATGCEGRARCGTNPTNRPACPPPATTPTPNRRPVPYSRRHLAAAPPPPGAERCSVPADSPLTGFNETALVDPAKGWKGCDDYVGWGKILGAHPSLSLMRKPLAISGGICTLICTLPL